MWWWDKLRRQQRETIVGWYMFAIVVIIAALLITAGALDSDGRDPENHVEAVPARVTRLSPSAYLIKDNASVTPGAICDGGTQDGHGVYKTQHVSDLKSTFTQCYVDQTWSTKKPESPNYGTALVTTLSSALYIIPSLLLLMAVSIYPFSLWRREVRNFASARQKHIAGLEDQRREIVTAYAKEEIDSEAFRQALDRLYAEGLTPAKD